MAERQESSTDQGERRAAILALLTGALIWGLIWYPYRILRDAGIDGIVATTLTYSVAFVLGLIFFRRSLTPLAPSWSLFWLALAAGACNLGYVLATLSGEVMRVLLLFYLAPLWTVLLAHLLLGERLNRFGVFVIALSLAGAATMLWHPRIGLPVPHDGADWLGLGAGFSFALFNVLSRREQNISIEHKSLVAFVGVVSLGALLLLAGAGRVQAPTVAANWVLLGLIGGVLVVVNLVVQYGLARIAANRAIVIMLSEVGFAALSSWLLANEALGLREWVGGAMIVAASVFSAKMENVESASRAKGHNELEPPHGSSLTQGLEDSEMQSSALGFLRIKVIALSTLDIERANKFYRDTLSLAPAFEGDTEVGYFLGQTILMLKTNWYAPPSDQLNPRLTIATEHAHDTEQALRARGVTITDPVQPYGDFYVGSFLDSEGNKLWFCSPVQK